MVLATQYVWWCQYHMWPSVPWLEADRAHTAGLCVVLVGGGATRRTVVDDITLHGESTRIAWCMGKIASSDKSNNKPKDNTYSIPIVRSQLENNWTSV